jgi:hypothetical protein
MAKAMKGGIILLVIILFVLSSGCNGNGTPGGTTTPPITAVPSTTVPPSTTIPPTITVTPNPSFEVDRHFIPSGWMGDTGDIKLDANNAQFSHTGVSSIQIIYSAKATQGQKWAGIYWQYPESNWGNNSMAFDLRGYTALTFWARGEKGGEKAEFKVGGIDGNAPYPDSIQPPVSSGIITLTSDWKQYTINLSGQDLSHVIGGFCWVTTKDENPNGATIYLDDIQFEKP